MVKVFEGGGGKGICKVVNEEIFEEFYKVVVSEIFGFFIFVMKLVDSVRYLEV